MKLHIMSDLHLEFGHFEYEPKGDVLVLAGDIHVGMRAKPFILEACKKYKAVILVLGNHEFYNQDYEDVIEGWRNIEDQLLNFFLLDNDQVILGDVRFIGTTLWTHGTKPMLNDFDLIWKNNKLLTIQDTQEMHDEACVFLAQALDNPFNGKTVVVTHHAPIPECVVPKYTGNPINEMFHANLNALITVNKNVIDLWVHGHMHDSIHTKYKGVDIVCNPRGYVGHGANWGFTKKLVMEI